MGQPTNGGRANGFGPPGGFAGAAAGPPGIFTSGNHQMNQMGAPQSAGLSFGTGIGTHHPGSVSQEREPPNYAFGSPGGQQHPGNGGGGSWGAPGHGLGMAGQTVSRGPAGFGAPGGPVGARPVVGVGAPFGAVGAPINGNHPNFGSATPNFGSPPGGFANQGNHPEHPPAGHFGSPPGYQDRAQPPRPTLPMPPAPPLTPFVGNFPYECSQDEVVGLFAANACAIADVRMVRNRDTDRPRGYFLEFEDLPSLQRALCFDGHALGGRPLRVNVAEGRPERRDRNGNGFGGGGGFAERYNNDRGRGPGFPGGGFGNNNAADIGHGGPGGGPGGFGGAPMGMGGEFVGGAPGASFGRREGGGGYQEAREGRGGRQMRDGPIGGDAPPRRRSFDRPADRVLPSDLPAPEGRKKLVLAARSVPASDAGGDAVSDANSGDPKQPSTKPNPFGGARPVDSTAKIAETERKIKDERDKAHALLAAKSGPDPTPVPAPKPHQAGTGAVPPLSKSAVQPPATGRRGPLIMAPKQEPVIKAQNAFAMLAMDDDDDDEEEDEDEE